MTLRWLGLALYAEGPTDHRLLDVLLRRAVEHLLVEVGYAIDVSPMLRLPRVEADSRAERVARGAQQLDSFHILFVHADGGSDPVASKSWNVAPAIEQTQARLGDRGRRTVAVVPVRETEAWALADVECLRESLGTTRSAAELGIRPPQPSWKRYRTLRRASVTRCAGRARLAAGDAGRPWFHSSTSSESELRFRPSLGYRRSNRSSRSFGRPSVISGTWTSVTPDP